jgi:DNA-binding transcriptional ArsR family regulator
MSWLVTARRQGTFIYYSAVDEHVRRLLAQALHHADNIDFEVPLEQSPTSS